MKQKRNITEGIRKFNVPLVLGVIFVVWIIVTFWQERQYQTTIKALTSIPPEQVTMFRIYPRRVGTPIDTHIEFTPPDSIITDFFQALTDQRPYSYSHDRAREEQQWFFEVAAGEVFIQISFHIPYDNDNIVAGMLGKFTKNSTRSYGYFQSRQLYQWYQTYSHRWLTPEGSPPAPLP